MFGFDGINYSIDTSLQHLWERRATVRSRPQRQLSENEGHFYPISRQPLCSHPLVKNMGEDAIQFILIQSAYKFMWDIAQIETRLVNNVAEKIANDRFTVKFPEGMKFNGLTVLVDESYHAYVARDFMHQLYGATKVSPIAEVVSRNFDLRHYKYQ